MIKAIETEYKGYRFRSRLEARWAVFFDAAGIRYKYEEYGFEAYGNKWLPDFYLPDFGVWAEVKGGFPSPNDAKKMAGLLDFGSPLPFFSESDYPDHLWSTKERIDMYKDMGGQKQGSFRPGVILLGDIPNINHGLVIHPFITHSSGLIRGYVLIMPDKIERLNNIGKLIFGAFCGSMPNQVEFLDGIGSSEEESIQFFTPSVYAAESKLVNGVILKAYKKARSARFEHGESG